MTMWDISHYAIGKGTSMQGFELVIYTKANGETPVLDFLQTLPEKMKAKAVREILRAKKYRDDYRKEELI